MAKGNILSDTFEQLVELGQGTAKKTVKSVAQTLNPLAAPEKTEAKQEKALKEKLENKKDNHTPLDFEKLKNQYEKNDSKNTDALRLRLFQLVKQGDEGLLYKKRQKEIGEKRQQAALEQQKKKEQEKRKKTIEQGDLPKGKERRSIFSVKKTAERQHAETKPAIGKQ
jgi:hypothetical protein